MKVLDDLWWKGWERDINNQTNTGTISKAILGEFLRRGGAHTGLAECLDTILNWSKLDGQGNKKRYIFWLMGTSDRNIVWTRILLSIETMVGISIKTYSEHKRNHYHTLFYSISSISPVHSALFILKYCNLRVRYQDKPNQILWPRKKRWSHKGTNPQPDSTGSFVFFDGDKPWSSHLT